MSYLGRRIRWWHSYLNWAWGKVNISSNYVNLGQIFNFFTKMSMLFSFISGFQKSYSFVHLTVRNPINCISKSDVMIFACFLVIAQPKIKILLFNMTCLLFKYSFVRYSPVLDNFKVFILFYGDLFCEKIEKVFLWGENHKISQISYSHYVESLLLCLLVFLDCALPQTCTF